MKEEVLCALKKKRSILFSPKTEKLQPLFLLLSVSDRRAVILWALEQAEQAAREIARNAEPALQCIRAAADWASGKIEMPQAKRYILACHAATKQTDDLSDAALFPRAAGPAEPVSCLPAGCGSGRCVPDRPAARPPRRRADAGPASCGGLPVRQQRCRRAMPSDPGVDKSGVRP